MTQNHGYRRPERKQPSLHGFDLCLHWVSVVRAQNQKGKMGWTKHVKRKNLFKNDFSSPLHAWLEFRATETLAKCRRKVQITTHQNHFSQFSERQAQLLLTYNSKLKTTRNSSWSFSLTDNSEKNTKLEKISQFYLTSLCKWRVKKMPKKDTMW